VRWDDLFDDLAARTEHTHRLEREGEVADRIRRDEATVLLAARVRAATGDLGLVLRDGSSLNGLVEGVGPDWILVRDATTQRQVLLPAGAVSAVRDAPRHSAAPQGAVAARRTLVLAIRALADAGVDVRVRAGSFEVRGTITRVGADHLDLVVDRSARGTAAVSVTFANLLSVTEVG